VNAYHHPFFATLSRRQSSLEAILGLIHTVIEETVRANVPMLGLTNLKFEQARHNIFAGHPEFGSM
jgi:hypothetical protein